MWEVINNDFMCYFFFYFLVFYDVENERKVTYISLILITPPPCGLVVYSSICRVVLWRLAATSSV